MKEYFNCMEGIKIEEILRVVGYIPGFIHGRMRIVNISNNDIANISFFTDGLPTNNAIEFIDISHNKITNISGLLMKLPFLK